MKEGVMSLNKQKGNMYPWVTHTINFIKGRCPHDCSYCYAKRYYSEKNPQPELHLVEKELKTDLGQGNFIFVGSSCDMWAKEVPDLWINKILLHCYDYKNRYFFQTKNPKRYISFLEHMPPDYILGITIETNRDFKVSSTQCPTPIERFNDIIKLQGAMLGYYIP